MLNSEFRTALLFLNRTTSCLPNSIWSSSGDRSLWSTAFRVQSGRSNDRRKLVEQLGHLSMIVCYLDEPPKEKLLGRFNVHFERALDDNGGCWTACSIHSADRVLRSGRAPRDCQTFWHLSSANKAQLPPESNFKFKASNKRRSSGQAW